MADRWASFDCYGTLIDWDGGIRRALFSPGQLARYHELEPQVQAECFRSYRDVMTETMRRLGEDDPERLARSLPEWEPFPEAPAALAEARRRGWKLALLSNTDRDLIAASRERIGVPFDLTVTAEDVGSYKPAHRHWERFFVESGADRAGHVHVAASLFHDITPANELGLRSVWVNRLGETPGPEPTRELPDLSRLPETLAELV